MVTKGIIMAIPSSRYNLLDTNYAKNTCDIRIPLFESVTSSGPVIIKDTQLIIQPGIYENYRVDDVVWVAFENGKYEQPVILGKVYTGPATESEDFNTGSRNGMIQQNTIIAQNAILPKDTVFCNDPKKSENAITFTAMELYQALEAITEIQAENSSLKQEITKLKTVVEELKQSAYATTEIS